MPHPRLYSPFSAPAYCSLRLPSVKMLLGYNGSPCQERNRRSPSLCWSPAEAARKRAGLRAGRSGEGWLRQSARESSRIRLSLARQSGIRARMAAHSEDYPGPPFGSREGNSLPAQLRGARIYSAAYWLRLARLPCLVSRFGPAPGCRRGSDVEQGLIQIPDDVLDILDSYRQPDQSVGNANAFADLRWHGGVGHERGERNQRLHSAQAFRKRT